MDRTHAEIGIGYTTCNANVTTDTARHAESSERRTIAHWATVDVALAMIETYRS